MVSLDSGVRPTLNEFKEVFDTDPNAGGISDAGLKAYLNAAHQTVANHGLASDLDESTLTKIEKFLAADFARAQEPLVQTEAVADARKTYARTNDGSDYKAIVNALDTTGLLAGAENGKAQFGTFGPGRD